jgi:hypothetical protein
MSPEDLRQRADEMRRFAAKNPHYADQANELARVCEDVADWLERGCQRQACNKASGSN